MTGADPKAVEQQPPNNILNFILLYLAYRLSAAYSNDRDGTHSGGGAASVAAIILVLSTGMRVSIGRCYMHELT